MKGHMDIDLEINKAKVRLAETNEGVFKQRKMLERLEKAGEMEGEVAETESRRLEDARRELGVLEGSMSKFERLKLEYEISGFAESGCKDKMLNCRRSGAVCVLERGLWLRCFKKWQCIILRYRNDT